MASSTPSPRTQVCSNCQLEGPLFADGEPMDIRPRLSSWGDIRPLCFRCAAAFKLEAREREVDRVFTRGDREMLKEMGITLGEVESVTGSEGR